MIFFFGFNKIIIRKEERKKISKLIVLKIGLKVMASDKK